MANPFLVLGGIAVGLVTATFGVLQVPGWVASAQDAAAVNDLANIRDAQAVRLSTSGAFANDFDVLSGHGPVALGEDTGVSTLALARGGDGQFAPMAVPAPKDKQGESIAFSLSFGTTLKWLGTNGSADAYCAVVQSASGRYFAVSDQKIMAKNADSRLEAMDDAACAPDTRPAAEPGEPGQPGEPEPSKYGKNDLVIRVNTLAAGCTNPAVQAYNGDAVINWGDGKSQPTNKAAGAITHTYETPGEYEIIITGTFAKFQTMPVSSAPCVIEVPHWGSETGVKSLSGAFNGATNLTYVAKPPAGVEQMNLMFSKAAKFNQDISDWDVSNVDTMLSMFSYASSFNQDLSGWKPTKVKNMNNMFANATSFNGSVNWGETPALTDTGYMFFKATSFNQPVNWDMKSVGDMGYMFNGASSFSQDLTGWKNTSFEANPTAFGTTNFMKGSKLTKSQLPAWMP